LDAETYASPENIKQLTLLESLMQESNSLTQELNFIGLDLEDAIKRLGSRAPPAAMKQIILKLCSIRPFTAEELAEILNRKQAWLTRR